MPNDFEKQVQQKMEELTFVPQEPVWDKIEKQIRQKKKRRMIIWLPVMLLMIGGGIVLLSRQSLTGHSERRSDVQQNNYQHQPSFQQNKSAVETPQDNSANSINEESSNSEKDLNNTSRTDQTTAKSINPTSEITGSNNKRAVPNVEKVQTQKSIGISGPDGYDKQKASTNLNDKETETLVSQNQKLEVQKFQTRLFTPRQNYEKQISAVQINNESLIHGFQDLNSVIPPAGIERTDIVGNTSSGTLSDPVASKGINRKWEMGVMANAGISSMNNAIEIGPRAMDYNYVAGPSSGGGGSSGGYMAPSDIKNGLSFALGFVLKKQLGKRTFFTTGLQYNYYSTRMDVGSNIRRDTLVSSNRTIQEFYLNSSFVSNNTSYSTATSTYTNKYHFISLPVAIDYQVLRKFPLNVHLGFSYQRLIATNALQYDYAKSIYYKENSVFNKNQFFSEFGINYSFMKRQSLIIGPQFQYGFTSLDGNSNHHLGAFVLKASYMF